MGLRFSAGLSVSRAERELIICMYDTAIQGPCKMSTEMLVFVKDEKSIRCALDLLWTRRPHQPGHTLSFELQQYGGSRHGRICKS